MQKAKTFGSKSKKQKHLSFFGFYCVLIANYNSQTLHRYIITMARVCKSACNMPEFTASDIVFCSTCAEPCHIKCYGLTHAQARLILEHANIQFRCEFCLNNKNDIATSLRDLKISVDGLHNTFQQQQLPDNTPKRRKPALTMANSYMSQATPTQVQKVQSITGTSSAAAVISSVEARKLVFISQLDPSTPESNIIQHVQNQLGDINISLKVNALIPRGKNITDIDFISFKLSLPESYFNKVVNASFWPKGVLVREFINYNRPFHHRSVSLLPPAQPPTPFLAPLASPATPATPITPGPEAASDVPIPTISKRTSRSSNK